MRKKPWSRVEREWAESQLGRLSVREMAERLGRSKSDVGRTVVAIRAEVGLPMPPDPRYPDADEPDPPDGTEGRLLEVASRLRAAMLVADEKNLAAIARQYRETVLALGRVQGAAGSGDGEGDPPAGGAGDQAPGGGDLLRMAIEDRARRAGGSGGRKPRRAARGRGR